MVSSESGKPSDNEENLCVIGEGFAVLTVYYDNEGDVRSVCSFILLMDRKQAKQKRSFYQYVRRKDLFFHK